MVAGATGIDVVMLVVAADDGVMPQTREHLAIIDLLGISEGVVALTKSDLADPDWLELVRADIERLLEGTSLEGAPIVAVSAKTGDGLPELLADARHACGGDQGPPGQPHDAPSGRPRVHHRGCGYGRDRHHVVRAARRATTPWRSIRAAFAGASAACRYTAQPSRRRRPASASP